MSYSTSSLPTLSASSWRPPRTPPSTAPRQGLPQPPACKFLLYRGLQCLLQARDSCGRDVQEPLGLGLPSSAEGPGNQQKPLSPSTQICREEGRGGRKSGLGQQSVKTVRGCVDMSFTVCQHCPLTGPPAGLGPSRGPERPQGLLSGGQAGHCSHFQGTGCPGDRVWGSH